jgi:hypothetical protein
VKLVSVLISCNDQHGTFEGCVRRLNFGETALYLEAISLDRPPRLSFVEFTGVKRILRISGRVFPIRSYSHCAAGLYRDHVWMEPPVAAELLNFLKTKATFATEGGNTDLFETFGAEGIQFSAQGLEAACAA